MKPYILNDEEDNNLYRHQCGNFKSCVLKNIQTIESNRHDKICECILLLISA